jgi:hypothetical protein
VPCADDKRRRASREKYGGYLEYYKWIEYVLKRSSSG